MSATSATLYGKCTLKIFHACLAAFARFHRMPSDATPNNSVCANHFNVVATVSWLSLQEKDLKSVKTHTQKATTLSVSHRLNCQWQIVIQLTEQDELWNAVRQAWHCQQKYTYRQSFTANRASAMCKTPSCTPCQNEQFRRPKNEPQCE